MTDALVWAPLAFGGEEAVVGPLRIATLTIDRRGIQPLVRLAIREEAIGEGAAAESYPAARPAAIAMARKLLAEQVAILQGCDAVLALAEQAPPPVELTDPQWAMVVWIGEGGEDGRVVPGQKGGTAKVLREKIQPALLEYVPVGAWQTSPAQRLTDAGKARLAAGRGT